MSEQRVYRAKAERSPLGTISELEQGRYNAGRQPLPKAGATEERTLEAVGCIPWLDRSRSCA